MGAGQLDCAVVGRVGAALTHAVKGRVTLCTMTCVEYGRRPCGREVLQRVRRPVRRPVPAPAASNRPPVSSPDVCGKPLDADPARAAVCSSVRCTRRVRSKTPRRAGHPVEGRDRRSPQARHRVFADLKGWRETLVARDPEEARQVLDPVLERSWSTPVTATRASWIRSSEPGSWRCSGPDRAEG